ncbi:hypothetical protein CH373_13695 [Leptospira perolatii]|uniref:Heme-binding protein HmuY n=2 Tax=Leptospira perolatii TaxID=2023191 RepID=A0A2M9ZK79_9LEPT|nr:hypothetical protein CH360_11260 [Leptospira perolatii]PJZ72466.1 hypothetical protein CH373_13695 [Leptospira perolatii]
MIALMDNGFGGSAQGEVITVSESDYFLTRVNAASQSDWVYVSLDAGGLKTSNSGDWDLRFKRFWIGTNSGTGGPKNGGSCDSGSTNWNQTFSGSECTVQVDSSQSQQGQSGTLTENVSPSMADWYSYNGSTHILTPTSNVYIIRSSDGADLFSLQMRDYYSEAGTSGYPTFRWRRL